MKTCGCVKFSMPSDQDTPVCGAMKIQCFYRAQIDLLKRLHLHGQNGSVEKKECDCLPSCTSITYDAEISQIEWDWKPVYWAWNNLHATRRPGCVA